MLTLAPRKFLVENSAELPELKGKNLYMDFETTSGDKKTEAFFPYFGHQIAGIAVTSDNTEQSYYVPLRHKFGPKIDPLQAINWMNSLLENHQRWVNHNVKFDAHFAHCAGVKKWNLDLVCTEVLARLKDSDRILYNLKVLRKDWLKSETQEEVKVSAYLKSIKSKDYGDLPADMAGEYACEDVLSNRELYKHCMEVLPEEQYPLWRQEVALTERLFRMERRGCLVDIEQVAIETVNATSKVTALENELYELCKVNYVNSPDCMYEILCVQLGLPVLLRNEPDDEEPEGTPGSPSFSKRAMQLYQGHPEVVSDEKKRRIVKLLAEIKKENTFLNLYCKTFLMSVDLNHRMHPSFRQNIRTGRMACNNPNGQNLNERSKKLIIPPKGFTFGCQDASQIEFRIIADVCDIKSAIHAYQTNPKTDYHQWVADLCGFSRKPAKTMNFLMAYGGGRAKAMTQLTCDEEIMKHIAEQMLTDGVPESDRAVVYKYRAEQFAHGVYSKYHAALPEIRQTSEAARAKCEMQGFIRNKYKRRRHLPAALSYRAFNTYSQGTAMDVIKERMIVLGDWLESQGAHLILNVHDELLEEIPDELAADPAFNAELKRILEDVQVKFRVPFLWECGLSKSNWQDAKDDGDPKKREAKQKLLAEKANAK